MDWNAVDERLDSEGMRGQLRQVLEGLTPAEREAFLLVAWEGLSTAEAATTLDVSPIVVRTRLSRARQRARTILAATPPLPVV